MSARTSALEPEKTGSSSGLVFLLALTCSLIAAGSYLVQPILPLIGTELHLGGWSGLAVTLTQLGFCLGLILIAPLGDLIENRSLVLFILAGSTFSLTCAGLATGSVFFFAACFFIGLTATAVQIVIPMAAYLVDPETRGRVMGSITSGLLLGVMLSRPISSLVTYTFGWRAMFFAVSTCVLSINILLIYLLPQRKPQSGQTYPAILSSLWTIMKETPRLRSLACCQAFLFSSFSLFWTAVPFELVSHYGLNQRDIGFFALVGAGGALSSFFAGRIQDNTKQLAARLGAIVTVGVTFTLISSSSSLWILILSALLIDAAVQLNHVLTQRAVVAISPTKVGRLNSLYATTIFIGASCGSALALPLFAHFGWIGVSMTGVGLAIGALVTWSLYLRN
jgi:predicted MFS family arabinose efflux permease